MASSSLSDVECCTKCENTLTSFIVLCESEENVFEFLYKHKVLYKTKKCKKCNASMWFHKSRSNFVCTKTHLESKSKQKKKYVKCGYQCSLFTGSFFENHHISRIKICKFVAYWALLPHPRQNFLLQELDISTGTIVDYSSYLRDVCFYFISNNSEPLGGPGKTVEIDEAKICETKYNKGRIIEGNWIFGGIERESKKTFILPVENRDKDKLLTIIKDYILPGTTVISDCWKSYDCLQSESYQNLIVNHSYNFVDPVTGANDKLIERLWCEVRSGVPRYGNKKHHLHGHLAEFLFKRKFCVFKERLHHLWIAISQLYQPTY